MNNKKKNLEEMKQAGKFRLLLLDIYLQGVRSIGSIFPFVLFFILVFSIFSPIEAIAQSNPAKGYSKQQVLFLQFGNGTGDKEVKVLGNPFCGPEAMAIDKDEDVYISDPGNHRIQVFSNKGDLINSIPTDSSGSALQVSENGDIYTAYLGDKFRSKVLIIKKSGEKIKTDQEWGVVYNDALWDRNGNQIGTFEKYPSTSSKFNEPLFLKRDVTDSYDVKRGGDWFLHIQTEKINRIAKKNGKGTNNDSIKIQLVNKQSLRLQYKVLGFDDDGNVYLLEGYIGKHPMLLKEEKILIYSIGGYLVSEIKLDIDACFDNGLNQHFFSVDKKGDIFQLLTTHTGAYVYKWTKD